MSDEAFVEAYRVALVRFLADPRSAELLASLPASAWNRGGAMTFATALATCLGGTLMSVGWYALLADHVVVAYDGMLFDAEGVYCEDELLAKRSQLARAPLGIWPLTASTVTPALGSEAHRANLTALLASYLPVRTSRARKPPAEAGVERRRRSRKAATVQNSKAARV